MSDDWSGFADLLANLIEKYAADLNIDNLPEPEIEKKFERGGDGVFDSKSQALKTK